MIFIEHFIDYQTISDKLKLRNSGKLLIYIYFALFGELLNIGGVVGFYH
jgi:hypothetical protein